MSGWLPAISRDASITSTGNVNFSKVKKLNWLVFSFDQLFSDVIPERSCFHEFIASMLSGHVIDLYYFYAIWGSLSVNKESSIVRSYLFIKLHIPLSRCRSNNLNEHHSHVNVIIVTTANVKQITNVILK